VPSKGTPSGVERRADVEAPSTWETLNAACTSRPGAEGERVGSRAARGGLLSVRGLFPSACRAACGVLRPTRPCSALNISSTRAYFLQISWSTWNPQLGEPFHIHSSSHPILCTIHHRRGSIEG
jgi:hypothetical protein